jgi:hypothetical protein
VVARVPELEPRHKPCYVTARASTPARLSVAATATGG